MSLRYRDWLRLLRTAGVPEDIRRLFVLTVSVCDLVPSVEWHEWLSNRGMACNVYLRYLAESHLRE